MKPFWKISSKLPNAIWESTSVKPFCRSGAVPGNRPLLNVWAFHLCQSWWDSSHLQLHLGFLLGIEAVLLWITSFGNRDVSHKLGNALLASAVLILLLLSIHGSLHIDNTRLHVGDLQARTNWLKANATPSDIIMTEAPLTDFLYSGRKTVRQPESLRSAGELEAFLVDQGIDYILFAPQIEWQPNYVPTYSDRTTRLLPQIAVLISENRISVVYSSERDLIKVFRIQTQE
jgi:hypothetical protein